MADQSDVETALVRLIAGVLYRAGPQAPSILKKTCRVYRGWPQGAALDADLAAERVNVTVFPEPRNQALTTRHPDEYTPIATVVPKLAITIAGDTATVSGSAAEGQVAGLLVDNVAVVHRTARGDTPEMVAAVLATYLRTRRMVTVAGATLTVPGAGFMLGRVVADQVVRREMRRQRQTFRVTAWCPNPAARDTVAAAIDTAFAALDFIDLADGTQGRLLYRGSSLFDQSQNARLYRRDLLYAVDYATTQTTTMPAMIFGDLKIAPSGGATPPITLIG